MSRAAVIDACRKLALIVGVGAVSGALATLSLAQPNTSAAQVTASSFTARGLQTEDMLTKLFSGDFLGIEFDRNDVQFNGLFDQYLMAYSRHCSAALPADKVEMTKQECVSSTTTTLRNGWGTLISSSTSCNQWRTVSLGWAKPALYSAKRELAAQLAADSGRVLSQTLGDMTTGARGLMAQLAAANAIAGDMDELVQMNACSGPGLRRFEQNLRLFALNRQPVRLDGSTLTVAASVTAANQDYTKLIADLVEDDAKDWGMAARLIPGSVRGASVSSRDGAGRPSRVQANYEWDGLLGRAAGTVTLRFTDGLPDCFVYSETPAVCHAANRRIVAAYANGGYGPAAPAPAASAPAAAPQRSAPAAAPQANADPNAMPYDHCIGLRDHLQSIRSSPSTWPQGYYERERQRTDRFIAGCRAQGVAIE